MAKVMEGSIEQVWVDKLMAEYQANDKNGVVRRSLSRSGLADSAYEPTALARTNLVFSDEIKTMAVTNQNSSGRCWIFAGLNLLREIVAKKCFIQGKFELSQNYISLYDKIEKANFAMESIVSLAQYSPNERVFQFVLDNPVSDGGQWDMFVNLVSKYGIMPKSCFPETYHSNATRETNFLVNAAIRKFAHDAHLLAVKGKPSQIRTLKEEVLKKIYTLYLNAFGVPPKEFEFEWVEVKNGKETFKKKTFTPKSFFDTYIGKEINEYQSLINSPTEDKPFGKNYTIDYLGNVVEGKPINHVNVTMDEMKEAIIKQLKAGEPVWFGSDVSFYRDRDTYAWDSGAFDFEGSYGIPLDFEKGDMLDYRHSAMNHAMVIVGVDLAGGVAKKWKIENSWGDNNGSAGYYVMSAEWFDRFVYQAVVKTKYLKKETAAAAKKSPIHLNPWDPMGTLAD